MATKWIPTTLNDPLTYEMFGNIMKHPKAQEEGEMAVSIINVERSKALRYQVKDNYKFVIKKIDDDVFGIDMFKEVK